MAIIGSRLGCGLLPGVPLLGDVEPGPQMFGLSGSISLLAGLGRGEDTQAPRRLMGFGDPGAPGFSIRTGSTNKTGVRLLQGKLDAAGYPLAQDGIFGVMTDSAVKSFQRNRGLTPDGIVGPLTWSTLESFTSDAQPSIGHGYASPPPQTTTLTFDEDVITVPRPGMDEETKKKLLFGLAAGGAAVLLILAVVLRR